MQLNSLPYTTFDYNSIQEVWNEALTKMKAGLMNEDQRLYNQIKIRPNSGSLAQGENPDNSEVA
jgi:hypothetical protein